MHIHIHIHKHTHTYTCVCTIYLPSCNIITCPLHKVHEMRLYLSDLTTCLSLKPLVSFQLHLLLEAYTKGSQANLISVHIGKI
jgi:hypothetical protein